MFIILFEHLKPDDMTSIIKSEGMTSFEDLLDYIKQKLTHLFAQYRMNENVASVLEVIGHDYQKDLSLKDISKTSLSIPVYLGQLIKRETNSTFAELLNKQRIKAAQQLLCQPMTVLKMSVMQWATAMLDILKVFRKLCGKSPRPTASK